MTNKRPWTEGPWEASGTIYGWGDKLCITAPEWGDKPMLTIPCHDSAFYTQNRRRKGENLILTTFSKQTPEGEATKAHFEAQRIAVMHLVAAAPAMYEALDDLINLAQDAMMTANRDGAEYDIDNELAEARAALREANPGAFAESTPTPDGQASEPGGETK